MQFFFIVAIPYPGYGVFRSPKNKTCSDARYHYDPVGAKRGSRLREVGQRGTEDKEKRNPAFYPPDRPCFLFRCRLPFSRPIRALFPNDLLVRDRLCAPNDKPPYLCVLIAPASRYIFHSFPLEETDADKAFVHVLEGIVMAVVTEGMGMIDEVGWLLVEVSKHGRNKYVWSVGVYVWV